MKRSDHDQLLQDLLTEESLEAVRRRSLEEVLVVARHRKQRTRWTKAGLITLSLGAAFWLLVSIKQSPSERKQVALAPTPVDAVAPTPITPATMTPATLRFISDDELLALFPGRALALIGPPGQMSLVFLEPSSAGESDAAPAP